MRPHRLCFYCQCVWNDRLCIHTAHGLSLLLRTPHQTPTPAVLETLARLPQIPLLSGHDRLEPCQNFSKKASTRSSSCCLWKLRYATSLALCRSQKSFRIELGFLVPGQTSAIKQQQKVFNSWERDGVRHVYMFELNPTPACLSRHERARWGPGACGFWGFGWLSQSLNRNEWLTEEKWRESLL